MQHTAVSRAAALAVVMAVGLAAEPSCAGENGAGHDSSPAMGIMEGHPDEAPFLAENQAAMERMMAGMDVRPSGDADADFAAMMIPHHQGAIDMAIAELRHGRNEQLRRIAQEIIVEQQQEILAMRLALGQELPKPAAVQTQPGPHGHHASTDGLAVAPAVSPTRAQEQIR